MCECGVAQNAAHLLGAHGWATGGGGRWVRRGQTQSGVGRFDLPTALGNFTVYVVTTGEGAETGPVLDNLLAGAVSRHSLDRLNTSN